MCNSKQGTISPYVCECLATAYIQLIPASGYFSKPRYYRAATKRVYLSGIINMALLDDLV